MDTHQYSRSTRNTFPRARLDFYPTHPAAARALLAHVQFHDTIWEPACGDGAIVKELRAAKYIVIPTDIRNYP